MTAPNPPRRWLIRKRNGCWHIQQRRIYGATVLYIHKANAPTWHDAMTRVGRLQIHNYGRAA